MVQLKLLSVHTTVIILLGLAPLQVGFLLSWFHAGRLIFRDDGVLPLEWLKLSVLFEGARVRNALACLLRVLVARIVTGSWNWNLGLQRWRCTLFFFFLLVGGHFLRGIFLFYLFNVRGSCSIELGVLQGATHLGPARVVLSVWGVVFLPFSLFLSSKIWWGPLNSLIVAGVEWIPYLLNRYF